MKLSLTLFALFIISIAVKGQFVPNGSFDNWTTDIDGYLDPDQWDSSNLDQNGSANVFQATGQDGTGYSAMFTAVNVTGVPLPRGGNLEQFLLPYTGSGRPTSLKGFWKTSNVAFGDYIFISVDMYDANMVIIASASIQTSFSSTNMNWTAFDIPLSYTSSAAVTNYYLFAGLSTFSAQSINSVGYIDDLSFDIGTGVNEIQKPVLNSAILNNGIDFNLSFDLNTNSEISASICKMTGQEVKQIMNENLEAGHHKIPFDVSGLSSGIYSCMITNSSSKEVVRFCVMK